MPPNYTPPSKGFCVGFCTENNYCGYLILKACSIYCGFPGCDRVITRRLTRARLCMSSSEASPVTEKSQADARAIEEEVRVIVLHSPTVTPLLPLSSLPLVDNLHVGTVCDDMLVVQMKRE